MCKRAAAETLVVLPAAAAAAALNNNDTFQDLTWRRGSSWPRERERERVIHLWLLTTTNWIFSWRAAGGFVSCLWDSFHSRSCCDEAEQGLWSYAGFHGCTRTQQWRNRRDFCRCCCSGFLELLWDNSSSSTHSPNATNWGSSKLQNLLVYSIHLPTWPGCCCCCWVCNWPGIWSRSRIGRKL